MDSLLAFVLGVLFAAVFALTVNAVFRLLGRTSPFANPFRIRDPLPHHDDPADSRGKEG
ncbi:hypothetical protein [Bifidobacterium callitrichidarum]|uniref:hypothetical protein n=1 Tax=Bifidobacterium callitrichidarum TaxID=2052941 RepID=UPI0013049CBF|nr:hypothetical protein [Bifidobacterium callitrichidarum]